MEINNKIYVPDTVVLKIKNTIQNKVKGDVQVYVYTDTNKRAILVVKIVHDLYTTTFKIENIYDRMWKSESAEYIGNQIYERYRIKIHKMFFKPRS